ncbi:MAG: MFS transporter [Proteobacteria bacterium]|jgi:AAHS family 4-hydroxybenzoate transporter-like MFS transporter|nr:MFS transporter [Pseudomonadota bacterium]
MPKVLIAICSLIYLLDGLLHSILGPLAPEIAGDLGLTNAQLGPIFSANLLGQCIGLIVVPMLADRSSQRRVVLLALLGFGLAQAATALAQGATSLFIWRLITGLFLGGALPSCLALVTAAAPAPRRGFAIMVLFTGYGLGATLAGVVATAFSGFGGWRMAMLAAGLACLATALLGALYLRDPAAGDGASERASPERSQPLLIVSKRYLVGTLMLWLLFISMLTISYCLTSWLPTLLVEVGRDRQFAALSISIFSLGGIIAALGVGLLIDRWGATRTLISFLCIATVLLFAVGQVLATASGVVLMTLLALCGFFVLGAYGGINVVLATFYPASIRATGIGWAKSIGRIGTLVAPVLIGSALTLGMAETSIMSLFAVPAALAAVFLAVIAFRY